jgi:hypothetical protein
VPKDAVAEAQRRVREAEERVADATASLASLERAGKLQAIESARMVLATARANLDRARAVLRRVQG